MPVDSLYSTRSASGGLVKLAKTRTSVHGRAFKHILRGPWSDGLGRAITHRQAPRVALAEESVPGSCHQP